MSDETPRRTGTTDGLDEALDLSPGRFLHAIYALFHNKAFGLILILLTGLLSAHRSAAAAEAVEYRG